MGEMYDTNPQTALSPRQLQVLQKLSPEDQQLFLEGWNDPEEGATEPMGDLLDYQHGNRQGPQLPERGPTQLREEGGIEQQVLQSMGVGGGNPAKGPTGPGVSADQGMPDPTLPGPQDSPQLYEDPNFQAAAQQWRQMHGAEPATDSDFEGPGGVLELMQQMRQPAMPDPKQAILQKIMGGSQGGY